jgi:hypothetical protein
LSYGFSKFARWNDRDIPVFKVGEEVAALHPGAEYRPPGFALQYFLDSPVSLGLPDSQQSGR